MRTTPTALLFLLPFFAVACGESFEAGLANAPSAQRQTRPRQGHDVISNGQDSCPRSTNGVDPLPNRQPPCDEVGPTGATLSADAGGANP